MPYFPRAIPPAATPGSVGSFDDVVTGSGTMKTFVMPQQDAVFAFQVTGDAYPRIVVSTSESGYIAVGDGTYDPFNDGAHIDFENNSEASSGPGIAMIGPGSSFEVNNLYGRMQGDIVFYWGGAGTRFGPVLVSADGTRHRVIVANNGTLSTEAP